MKAINIEMVELKLMTADEARSLGHKVPDALYATDMGYEITYCNGGESWCLKELIDSTYYVLSKDNDGTKVLKEDVENFITGVEASKVGDKTTSVIAHTRTGFDMVRHSSCVDPNNYNEELGKQYAMEEVVNDLWGHLGFVLQWAKYGIDVEYKGNKYPPHIQRVIKEYEELEDKIDKLNKFINGSPVFKGLDEEERNNLSCQLTVMRNYSDILLSRLTKAGVNFEELI